MADVFKSDDTIVNPVETLVGDGKKFKDVEALAKGKLESDNHIARLEAELAGIREDLGKRVDAEAQLAEVRNELTVLRNARPQESKSNTSSPLTVDGIQALVNESITRTERNRTSQSNIALANTAMLDAFGSFEQATAGVLAKSKELGLSMDRLKEIAAESPTAFQKIILGDKAAAVAAPLDGRAVATERPQASSGLSTQEGTKAFYDELRTKNPKLYWDPRTQEKIIAAAKAGTYQPS